MTTFFTYFRESLEELRQVRWPTQQQAIRLTVIVTVFIAITSLLFGLLDILLMEVFRATLGV